MAEVAFHFNVPDRVGYTCRLLRKVWRAGHRAQVVVEPSQLHALDAALWGFAADEFLPHATQHAPVHVRERSPILLVDEQAAVAPGVILVNLLGHVPLAVEQGAQMQRLIEIVTTDTEDRALARQRWRWYTAQGHQLVQHDLLAKGAQG